MPLVAHDRIARTGAVAVVAAIALSVLLAPLGEPWRTGVAGVVAVLLIALGSPHGALDHLVQLHGRSSRDGQPDPGVAYDGTVASALRGLSPRFVTGYVALALASLGAYLLLPRTGFALFLVLSVAHFAAGEAGVAIERGLARGWRDPLAWVASLGGAVVVVLPLASREAGVALAAVDPRLAPVLSPLPLLADLVTVVAVLAVIGCIGAAARGDDRASTVALELGALTALAALAHPLIAFAAFFAFWHALRHQARLADVLRGPVGLPLPRHVGRPLREVVDSARAGVPATLGVLLGAGALALTGATLLGGLLAVIWALTVPHSVAVAVLEVRAARARAALTSSAQTGSARTGEGRGTGAPVDASKGHATPSVAGAGAGPAPAPPADGLRGRQP
jgi:Brp/Blh family beta-carotene 15,15'-monooxygenase